MRNLETKKEFWSLSAVILLAVVMPTILRQVNKATRAWAGAEGRLAAINIDTDRILGKTTEVFVTSGQAVLEEDVDPDEIRQLVMKYGANRILPLKEGLPEAYTVAMGNELVNTNMKGMVRSMITVTEIFERLGPQRLLVTGEGSWIFATATRDNDSYQVILANYDPSGTHSEVVPVNFLNIEAGKFELKKTFWGSPTTEERISTDAGIIQRMIPMPANSIVFLELESL